LIRGDLESGVASSASVSAGDRAMPRPSKQASRFISRSLRAPRAEAEGGCRHAKIAATLVERHTRYVMLTKVAGKDTQTVVSALIEQAKKLPKELYKSLTWDRGKELTDHRRFTLATKIDVYFCDPQSPWQRGSNENTNGLLRQYFPKGTDLSVHPQAYLNKVARQLNERPENVILHENKC
jgi:IS30 family transposase